MRRSNVGGPANRAGGVSWLWLIGIFGSLLAGCNGDGADSQGLPLAPPPATARSVGLIVPTEDLFAGTIYDQAIRHEGSKAESVVEVVQTAPGEQAEVIRRMARQGLSALIVVPEPTPEAAEALAEVRREGFPVVLLERSAASEVAKDVPLVQFPSVEETAEKIIAAGLNWARKDGFPEDAPAVVLVNSPADSTAKALLEALHRALDDAGVPRLPDIIFSGYQSEARKALEPIHEEHPEIGLVLFVEDYGSNGAAAYRNTLSRDEPRFAVAGFTHAKEGGRMADFSVAAAIAERRYEILAHRAFQVAIDLIEGKQITGRVEIPQRLVIASGPEVEGFLPGEVPTPSSPVVEPPKE